MKEKTKTHVEKRKLKFSYRIHRLLFKDGAWTLSVLGMETVITNPVYNTIKNVHIITLLVISACSYCILLLVLCNAPGTRSTILSASTRYGLTTLFLATK